MHPATAILNVKFGQGVNNNMYIVDTLAKFRYTYDINAD